MEVLYITSERLKLLKKDKRQLAILGKRCGCSIAVNEDDALEITNPDNDGYREYVARSVLFAYGRGFPLNTSEMLLNDDNYFETIDVGQLLGNEKRIHQVKARVIGENGKTKTYIESVSGAKLSVYGDTISFIGSPSQIEEARTAVSILVDGGTHKLAYSRMESAHRKNQDQMHDATF